MSSQGYPNPKSLCERDEIEWRLFSVFPWRPNDWSEQHTREFADKSHKKYCFVLATRRKIELENLKLIDGMGETQINSIDIFFTNKKNIKIISSLINFLNIKNFVKRNTTGVFSGKSFMFTGSLETMSRAEAKVLVANLGGKIASNVSKNLNYLIIGNKPTRRKLHEARDLKINILNEKDWNKLVNK